MGIYKPKKILFPNEYDEIGYRYSLQRLRNENVYDFKQRLIHQSRNNISQNITDVGFHLNNCLGQLEKGIFKIERKKDSNGKELYPYSYFSIGVNYFEIIKDYYEDEKILIVYRDFPTIRDLMNEVNSHSVLVCTELENVDIDTIGETYSLKVQDNLKIATGNLNESMFYNFNQKNLLKVSFYDPIYFAQEVDSYDKVKEGGQYYINYKEGKVWNYSPMVGAVETVAVEFPFYVKQQKIKINLAIKNDFDDLTKSEIEEIRGEKKKVVLNTIGSKFYKELFKSNPIYWGK